MMRHKKRRLDKMQALRRITTLGRHCLSGKKERNGRNKKIILITGVTSGLGRALAIKFHEEGHTVIGCGRRKKRIETIQQELGDRHHFFCCDVTNAISVEELRQKVERKLRGIGDVDILINNAGTSSEITKTPWEVSERDFDRVMRVNVKGVFLVSKAFIPAMIKDYKTSKRRKLVINMSSGLGHSTNPGLSVYSATKWAVESFSKSVAQGFLSEGLSGCICVPLAPGVIQTEMNPSKRFPTAKVWSQKAVPFILSKISHEDNGSSLTVPGFYSGQYVSSWVIPDGMKIPKGHVSPS